MYGKLNIDGRFQVVRSCPQIYKGLYQLGLLASQ